MKYGIFAHLDNFTTAEDSWELPYELTTAWPYGMPVPLQYTVSPQKTCDYISYNNFHNRCPITIIFGVVSSKSMCHRKMVSFPTSPI